MTLEVKFSLSLPRDELSVPLVRHICRYALGQVGVQSVCVGDLLLALTEACTNALDHAADGVEYQVEFTVDASRCIIRVKDAGDGFEYGTGQRVDSTAESGRGLEIMRSLVDRVDFTRVPEDGMIVHLEKDLEFDNDHPVRRRLVTPPG